MRRTSLILALAGLLVASFAVAQEGQTPPPAAPPAAAPAPTPIATPAATMLDEIKIVIEDKAKTDGEIRLDFTPEGGTAKAIRVTVAKKMSNKDVAEDLAKELKVALGEDYKVDRYDADKIKIEAKNKKKFSLTIAALTANGLSIRLK